MDKTQIGRSASFNHTHTNRYMLSRKWDNATAIQLFDEKSRPMAMCIGLNPSKADHTRDDHTIRILMKALDGLGFGGLIMVNLFTFISSDPEVLVRRDNGEVFDSHALDCYDNVSRITELAKNCGEVIFCWGAFDHAKASLARQFLEEEFPQAKCFGHNPDMSPMHPRRLHFGKIKPTLLPYATRD